MGQPECYISVDVETAGPVPSLYSMLSIGACLVDDPECGFYAEIAPESPDVSPGALDVTGLTMAGLAETGETPASAMERFAQWIEDVTPADQTPLFVGFNAPFDWMFVADYFHRHLGRNPFGHVALDVKAYYMGKFGTTFADSSMSRLSPRYLDGKPLSHNALHDARDQADLFRAIVADDVSDHNQ